MSENRRNRTIQIGLRLTVEELTALKREGDRRGWTLSQVLRRRALKGLDVATVLVGENEQKAVG